MKTVNSRCESTMWMLILLVAAGAAFGREPALANAPYMDASLGVDARLDDLVARMTLEEKVAALSTMKGFDAYEIRGGEVHPSKELKERYAKFPGCGLFSFFRADWYSGRNWSNGLTPDRMIAAYNAVQRYAVENTRLGIPLEICGCQFLGETTVPSGLGCAAMFDREALAAGTRMRLRERRTFSRNWYIGHPTADLALDPRWSRVEQTFGEDPYLSAEYNFVRARTTKQMGGRFDMAHFICHGIGEGGRMSLPVHVGDNEIYNVHMRPFEYGVKGGADCIMTCYNLIDGVPGLLRGDLVNGFLRGRLGYKGVFMADAGAIGALAWQGFAADLGEAAALAVKNGNDLCCWEADNYAKGLSSALDRGLVSMAELDVSVKRSLRGRFESGLFEHPYIDPREWAERYGRPEDVIGCRENRDVVLDMARKAMTLLENRGGVLPFDAKKVKRLAVIGPNADKPENQLGDYTAPQRPGQTITPRLGFEALGGKLGFEVAYARGCKVRSMKKDGFDEAISAAKSADAVVVCLGGSSVPDQALTQNEAGTAVVKRIATDSELDKDAGEGFDRAHLRLGGVQVELLKALKALGKPLVTVLVMGRPLVLDEVVANSDAVLLAWYPGTEGGTAVAETVFGLNNPGGRLPVSFPRSEGAIPCYYHALRDRGNYVDCEGSPAYPFGYGLSYTTFEVSKPKVEGNVVSVEVQNTGGVRGDDVVQMYIHDVKFAVARPVWELRGFERVTLEPGERRTVSFELTAKELGYWTGDARYVVEPGDFKVAVWDRFTPSFGPERQVTYTVQTSHGIAPDAKARAGEPGQPANRSVLNVQRTMKALDESTADNPATVRLLFYGQSITAQGWTKLLVGNLKKRYPTVNFVWENRAIGGYESPSLIKTAESDLYPFYPDILFFHVYGPLDKYEEIVRRVRERTTAEIVLWTSHLSRKQDPVEMLRSRDERSRRILEIAEKYGCLAVDLNRKWSEMMIGHGYTMDDLLVDGIHMKDKGPAWPAYAAFVGGELVRVPGTGGDPNFSGTVTTINLDDSSVRRGEDGAITLSFTGNRVVAVSDGTGQEGATAKLLLDGRPVDSYPEMYANTRPSAIVNWMPMIKLVTRKAGAMPVAEDWTLTYVEGTQSDGQKIHYRLDGSVTGFDGEGWNTNAFVSNSGRAVIEPDDFHVWQYEYVKDKKYYIDKGVDKAKVGDKVEWKTVKMFADPYDASPAGTQTVLVQNCANGPHTLTIIPQSGPVGIGAFIVNAPCSLKR